jgi:adenylate cyclase
VKARHLEELGRQSEANALIETALRLGPDSWEVNREAARMLFREERIAEAIPFFEKAVALMSSDFHNPITAMGCYVAIGDTEGAKRAARIALGRAEYALAHDPTNVPAISNGAAALAELGEEERARDWIERGLLLDPDSQYMRYNAACTLTLKMKDDDAALDVLEPFFERMGTALQMKHVEADQDFVRLRDKPRFQAMIAATKRRLGLAGVEPNEPSPPLAGTA